MSTKLIVPELDDLRGLKPAERELVAQIINDLTGAARAIQRAGERWASLSPETRKRVFEELPPTWKTWFNRLTLVGEHKLHPQLYNHGGRAGRLLGRLPYEDQERFLSSRIPVLIVKNRRQDVKHLDVEELTEEQSKLVFKREGDTVIVRTVEMQKAYLEDQERRQRLAEERSAGNLTKISRPGRWKVLGDKLYPDEARVEGGYSVKDIKLMLRDLSIEE